MLVWREKRKNPWSSRDYTRTFIQVVGEVGFSLLALRRTLWTQQKKSSYTFNLPPFCNMKNSRQKCEVTCPWSYSKSVTPDLLVSGSCCHYQWEEKNLWVLFLMVLSPQPSWVALPSFGMHILPDSDVSARLQQCGGWVRELLCHFLNMPWGKVLVS